MILEWGSKKLNSEKLIPFVFLGFIFYSIFEGVFRYIFLISGVGFLGYFIKFIMFSFICIKINPYITKKVILTFFIILIFLLYGFYKNGLSSSVISLFVFIPLLYFYIYPAFTTLENVHLKLLYIFQILIVIGLIFDYFMALPWVGYSGFVNGVEVSSGLQWWSNGQERLLGFGRSSYETATLLSFLCLISLQRNSLLLKILLITISLFGVYLTTSKGALMALLFASLFYFIPKNHLYLKTFLIIISILLGNLILLVTILNLNVDFLKDIYFSLYERIEFMWPSTINKITNEGGLLGLGLGGIGVADENNIWKAVDNFWLYLIAMFGYFVWVVFLIITLIASPKISTSKYSQLYIFFFIYSLTNNMLESVFGQVIFSMLIFELFSIIKINKHK
ncbi:hypothetical protein [Marinicellulosiphila megalodicopiae]|uniref:hypothetical protein n=1 Tax=Marinicellulosiphila megalodicopiae TaxID=2724896 RepID=UPI003BAE5EEE